jgi:uncharacterized membrane protein
MNSPSQYSAQTTTLGLPEWVERVLAYAGFWVSGLILLVLEKRNKRVRGHARTSLFIFGPLFLIWLILGLITTVLHVIPLLGGLLAFPFGLLIALDKILIGAVWVIGMVGAAIAPNFHLPGSERVQKLLD